MMQEDSFSDEYDFEDEYEPIVLADNDQENDKFIGEKIFGNLPLSSQVKEYFGNYKKRDKKKFMDLFKFKDQVEEIKSVCAKPIQKGQTIAQCYDCASDNSCIQCMDCFKNSNHQGHKVIIKKAYGGCCDCGDIEAWKKDGFCSKHTGQTIDIQIDPNQQENFLTEMKQLFFLLFRESIQQNTNFTRDYSNKLLKNLCYINAKGVYYNKLTYLLFSSKLLQQQLVSKNVNSRTILSNILSPKIAKNLQIDDWMQLFFSMFQYYPFKKLLLSTYMKNFSIIYGEEEAISRGTSISCQLLTSRQLVRDYALDKESVPMGSDIRLDRLNSFETIFFMLYHDLIYITKLQADTPQVYFKFHMTSKQAILKLFQYRKVIKNQQDKHLEEPDILQLARFAKYFPLEFKVIDLLAKVAGILQGDKETLLFVIKTLYQEALIQQNERKMIIFKPLTRCLGMFLFAYFDLDLKKLNHQDNKDPIQQLIKYLGGTNQQFSLNISRLFKVCMESYLFHAKILAEPGLNSTLYTYIYFYKIKNRLISSLDALNVKMLSIMHGWPQVSKQPVISPNDYIWDNTVIAQNGTQKQELQSRVAHLQFMLNQLNMVTASQSNQLYVAYHIHPNCELYQTYIENVLLRILRQEKGNFTLAHAKEDEEWFFHRNVDLTKNYLKKFCTYDKVKKAFILNKQSELKSDNSEDLINYNDFRCNITNKGNFQSPELTLELIKQSKNQSVFDGLWSIQTIKKFVAKGVEYMKVLSTPEAAQENQSFSPSLNKLKPLFGELMKVIYIKIKVNLKPEELQNVLQFLRTTPNCNSIINPFYQRLFYPQKMQEQKLISLQQVKLNTCSPKKSGLQKIKSTEEQRKKRLKDRMELKKKTIKERYKKQLVKFQSKEKIKLEKEQEQEFTEHKLNCIICKSDEQEDLVYLVKITFKNHEKLLGLGEGVTCISVSSCYHTVDYACYGKLQSEVGLKKRPLIKCPFCKFAANTFLPIKATSKYVAHALKKFEGSLFIEKNLDEVSILQEIVKSFYHYALLAYLDPQRTLHKRLRIYKILFEILKQNSHFYDIEKVYEKFLTRTMNLNPKVLEETYEMKRSQRLHQLSLILQNNDEQVSLDELSQSQLDNLLNAMSQQEEMNEEDSGSNPNMLMNISNKVKENLSPSKKKKEEEKPKNQMTLIFKQTLTLLFKELQMKEFHIEEKKPQFVYKNQLEKQNTKQESLEKSQPMKEQFPHEIQLCLKRLFDEKLPHNHNSIYEDLNENNDLLKLRDLPINFKPLGRHNKCNCCNEITSTISLCLLCDWQGCLRNCLASGKSGNSEQAGSNKKGGTFNHCRIHGQQSIFLILEKCNIMSITVDGLSSTLGCIYKDEWGNNFDHKQPWENFFLDQGELNRIKITFLHEQ